MSAKICIYPGCARPAVAPHLLGGPQPSFCDLEEHNALTAHHERLRLAREGADPDPSSEPDGCSPPAIHDREVGPSDGR